MMTSVLSYAAVIVTKQNGGRNGYVDENHSPGLSTLDCKDRGRTICEFTIDPILNLSYQSAASIADDNISNGKASGNEVMGNYKIEWIGTDIYNYELTLTEIEF